MDWAPIARIALRYVSGMMISYGAITPEAGQSIATDPDVILVVGMVLAALTEGAYAYARKRGWAT